MTSGHVLPQTASFCSQQYYSCTFIVKSLCPLVIHQHLRIIVYFRITSYIYIQLQGMPILTYLHLWFVKYSYSYYRKSYYCMSLYYFKVYGLLLEYWLGNSSIVDLFNKCSDKELFIFWGISFHIYGPLTLIEYFILSDLYLIVL